MLFFNLTMCQREGNTKQCNKRLERDFFFKKMKQPADTIQDLKTTRNTHCAPLVHTVHQEANEASQIRRVRRWEWLHTK